MITYMSRVWAGTQFQQHPPGAQAQLVHPADPSWQLEHRRPPRRWISIVSAKGNGMSPLEEVLEQEQRLESQGMRGSVDLVYKSERDHINRPPQG
jgi:hypothetical protein